MNISAIADYNHLITTRPHDIGRVLISDLHLSADEPALVQAFLALIDDLIALPNLIEFYILGDWFDAWIGDDSYLFLSTYKRQRHWLTPIINKLSQLSSQGCQIKIMHGNRDFLVGQQFCDLFQGQLIAEPYLLQLQGAHSESSKLRLEHGDALCTDDKSYQRFRSIVRNPVTQWLLLKRPLQKRLELAKKIRQKSALTKSNKSMSIMDVNQGAVVKTLQTVDGLLHGHTHRPEKHDVEINADKNLTKPRYVLGDWRVINPDSSYQQVEAVIAVTTVTTSTACSDQNLANVQSLAPADNTQSNNPSDSKLLNKQKENLHLVKFELRV